MCRGRSPRHMGVVERELVFKRNMIIFNHQKVFMRQKVHNIKPLEKNRKALRNNLTPGEAVLWRALQKSQLDGRKFRRQHSVGGYVLDFYCPTERLAVELDGAYHFTLVGSENDYERTQYINSLNIRVLRFENKRVFENIDLVLEEIRRHFKSVDTAEGG